MLEIAARARCIRCTSFYKKVTGNQKYCKRCAPKVYREQSCRSAQKWRASHYEIELARCRHRNHQSKLAVLTHYGKRGKLCCCWRNCGVSDIDCLTLDHIANNGNVMRRKGFYGGSAGYKQLIRLGFPQGYQTLCGGHQWKKEILRRQRI